MVEFDGMKVFSATKARERENLGDTITGWIEDNHEDKMVVDREVRQSSDNEFHCLSIILFYTNVARKSRGGKK